MIFNWDGFTEWHYNMYIKNFSRFDDYIGAVRVGDICIDLLIEDDNTLVYDFYVAHEDTGYGYKDYDDGMPYDYAEGGSMDIPHSLSYGEFKNKAEKLFEKFIMENDNWRGWNCKTNQYLNYSLIEHANRPLEIW